MYDIHKKALDSKRLHLPIPVSVKINHVQALT